MTKSKPGPKDSSARRASSKEGSEPMNAWTSTKSDISPERLAALRRRVAEGAYDAPEVVETVARRIIDSGDIRDGRVDARLDPRDGFGPPIH